MTETLHYDNINKNGNIEKISTQGSEFRYNESNKDFYANKYTIDKYVTYSYDDYNRLIKEETNQNSYNNYEYDSWGNLLKITSNNITKVFENTQDRCNSVTINGQKKNIEYDAYGNIIKYGDFEYQYNNINQLIRCYYIKDNCQMVCDYYYDFAGRRYRKLISQIKNNQTINKYDYYYYYNGNQLMSIARYNYEIKGVKYTHYFYDERGVCGLENNAIYYGIILDSLGNVSKITYDDKIIAEYTYDAYGNTLFKMVTGENDIYNSGFIADIDLNNLGYRGYQYDEETGLVLVSSRYYSPELGRFIQPADVSSLNPQSINGLNLYTYANNNPIGIAYRSASVIGSDSNGMVSCLPGSGSANRGKAGGTLSSWFTSLPAVPKGLKYISKANDVFSAMAHSAIVSNYLFHNLAFMDDMLIIGVNPAKALGYFSKASWINKLGNFLAAVDGIITVYDNLQQGNSLEQALLDGVMSFCVSAASAWVGGFVGANVGGVIGSLIGSFIPIPIVGTFIGFIFGTAIGVGVSWVVDNLLKYVKDEFLEWLFN